MMLWSPPLLSLLLLLRALGPSLSLAPPTSAAPGSTMRGSASRLAHPLPPSRPSSPSGPRSTASASALPRGRRCHRPSASRGGATAMYARGGGRGGGGEREDKFSPFQRIESIKTAALGGVAGSVLSAPFVALHDLPSYGAAAWEFDTDMAALQGALFAIVYRYCVREEDDNEMLNMGVV
ncbi:hypothetical protein ACHAWF_005843 [Thalassiosira exigua]